MTNNHIENHSTFHKPDTYANTCDNSLALNAGLCSSSNETMYRSLVMPASNHLSDKDTVDRSLTMNADIYSSANKTGVYSVAALLGIKLHDSF
jgi:hypothetical protein